MTIEKLINTYRELLIEEKRTPGSIRYHDTICSYLQFLNDRPVDGLSKDDLRNFYLHLKNTTNLGNKSINKIIAMLKKIYIYFDIENPALEKHKYLKTRKVVIDIFSRADFQKIFKYVNTLGYPYRPMMHILYHTGIRRSELLNLKWEHFNFENKTLWIYSEKTKSERLIIIPDSLINELKPIAKESGYCWWKEKLYTNDDLKNFYRRLKKHTGIKEINTKKFRHTYVTELLELGVDMVVVKDQAGHADISTTMLYTHISLNHRRKELEKITR